MKYVAWFIILLILFILAIYFWPVFKVELKYNFDNAARIQYVIGTEQLETFQKPLSPPDTDFSIIIPKIGAVSKVIDNVDPTDQSKYIPALKMGVAHAAGTAIPGQKGNVFLFDHSADYFWSLNTYNTVFYLIGKLIPGDEIDIFYQGNRITYSVYDKKITGPNETQYLKTLIPDEKTLTLQTDYPEGTSFQRLLIFAKQTDSVLQ